MSDEAFSWFVLLALWFALFGSAAFIGVIVESWLEWRRERRTNRRLPHPEWRARVHRRQTHTDWRVDD